jgi:tRNA-splicing ligase RtcB
MVSSRDFKRIDKYLYEVPQSFREDMRVPARFYADPELLAAALDDQSLEQLVNTATMPGVVKYALAMPDIHQGYGFPIGGVVATELPNGVISPGGVGYDINCLRGDSRVLHALGYTRFIADMARDWSNATLRCQDFSTQHETCAPIVCYIRQVPSTAVHCLTTEAGDEIVATADHPFWTPDGMVELARLAPGDRVARYPFEGVAYAPPGDTVLVDELDIERALDTHGKGMAGNALGQVLAQLRRRHLLPLRADSSQLPHLLRLLGYVFGDGTVYFSGGSGKGTTWFYGDSADLELIRADVASAGFTPSRVYTRSRRHRITTTYNDYEFEREEAAVKIVGSAFAALLAALGAPVGAKASQDYGVPAWLFAAPLWQQRLFLAAHFGAELSAPRAVVKRNCNFNMPVLSLNKRDGFVESGRQFLQGLSQLLAGFGVETKAISQRVEQANPDGSRSHRLRLVISSRPESLVNLWSRIGFEFNRKRQVSGLVAVEYLKCKEKVVAVRDEAASQAVALRVAGVAPQTIYADLVGEHVNRRFLERSLYEDRMIGARIGDQFETFEEFRTRATAGIEGSGMVWAIVATVEPADLRSPSAAASTSTYDLPAGKGDDGYVYDFTVAHPDHNFVANGFVVSNCGVRLLTTHMELAQVAPYLDDLASALYANCPSGVGQGGNVKLKSGELDRLLEEGARWAVARGFATEADLERTEEGGSLAGADAGKVSQRAKERGKDQVGTLGAGNHFIEVDVVDEVFDQDAAQRMGLFRGQVAAQIHCGSRGLGHQVCTDYVSRFQKTIGQYGIQLPDRELVCAPLSSPEGQAYLAAMKAAANYAFANRQVLAFHIRHSFEQALAGKVKQPAVYQIYDIAHNMAKVEEHIVDGRRMKLCVHRKGATRAFGPGSAVLPAVYRDIGQPVLVPGSMGTASWVLLGTEGSMAQTFGSTCHGAGRTMSRAKAKKSIWGAELRQELEAGGIHVRAGSMAGLAEEAPSAYKDVDRVVDVVAGAGIARKVARLVPVAVVKG